MDAAAVSGLPAKRERRRLVDRWLRVGPPVRDVVGVRPQRPPARPPASPLCSGTHLGFPVPRPGDRYRRPAAPSGRPLTAGPLRVETSCRPDGRAGGSRRRPRPATGRAARRRDGEPPRPDRRAARAAPSTRSPRPAFPNRPVSGRTSPRIAPSLRPPARPARRLHQGAVRRCRQRPRLPREIHPQDRHRQPSPRRLR